MVLNGWVDGGLDEGGQAVPCQTCCVLMCDCFGCTGASFSHQRIKALAYKANQMQGKCFGILE